MMNTLLQDIRYALRQLRKSPGFTLTVIVTLALGIGANAAVFTLFDQVLLRMLPVERPKELVRFEWTGAFSGSASSFGGDTTNYFSYPMYKDLRDQNQVFQGILAADKTGVGISWHNQAENEDAEVVTGNYFQLLGLQPAAGRLLTQQDDTAKNANPVVVLSYDYWKSRFAASRDIVGQTVLINGHPFTILGVAPAEFRLRHRRLSSPASSFPSAWPISPCRGRALATTSTIINPSGSLWWRVSSPAYAASRPRPAWGRFGIRCARMSSRFTNHSPNASRNDFSTNRTSRCSTILPDSIPTAAN